MNFTDGKWEPDFDAMTVHAYNEKDYVIAKISNVDSREEREGNLRLIAKSSEMYYSLRNMLFEFKRGSHNNPEYMKQVINHIEKLMHNIESDIEDTSLLKTLVSYVKKMRRSQEEYAFCPTESTYYVKKRDEEDVDRVLKQILQEVHS